MKKNGMGSHQQSIGVNQEWLTPPEIISSLGEFDLDPCAPVVRPWPTAKHHYTIEDDGLKQPWPEHWRVFLNPPYDRRVIGEWLKKMALHGNGISLIFARSDTKVFQQWIFGYASSILFMEGRITFHKVSGEKGNFSGGAPSVLVAYGERNCQALSESGIKGAHLPVNSVPIIIVGVSPSWRSVVKIAVRRHNGEADLSAVYEMVAQIAPDKIGSNPNWKAKIRQMLQYHFVKIAKGKYKESQLNENQ